MAAQRRPGDDRPMTDSERRRRWAAEARRCRDEAAAEARLRDAEARLAALLAWADVWTRGGAA
jgi:hypothetical protein